MQVQNVNSNQNFNGKITIFTKVGKGFKEKVFKTTRSEDYLIGLVVRDGISKDNPKGSQALKTLVRLITGNPLRMIKSEKGVMIDFSHGPLVHISLQKGFIERFNKGGVPLVAIRSSECR